MIKQLVFVAAVAYAADDGSYRPEHHAGTGTAYGNQQYHSLNNGRYYGAALPYRQIVPVQPIVSVESTEPVHLQPTYHYQPYVNYQSGTAEGNSQTLRDVRVQAPNGDYAFEFETDNGIVNSEQSQVLPPNTQRKTGFYQYPSPDGRILRVDWYADENGYYASGAHLPQSPKTPDAITRSVEYNLKFAKQQ